MDDIVTKDGYSNTGGIQDSKIFFLVKRDVRLVVCIMMNIVQKKNVQRMVFIS